MNDLFPIDVPTDAIFSDALRIDPVLGDGMFPRLREGFDFVLVKPVHGYVGEGTYVYHNGVGPELVCVQNMIDRLRLFKENQRYSDHYCSKEQFDDSVLAIVVADIKVRDHRFLEGGRRNG